MTSPSKQCQLWDARFTSEGSLWGDDASSTARCLLSRLLPGSCVLDCGCGYGRDAIQIARAGHTVHGIDVSDVGIARARLSLAQEPESVQARAFFHNTTCSKLPSTFHGTMDAIYSHRTLHLMDEHTVRDFCLAAHPLLKPRGLLIVSARDPRDFDSVNMSWISEGTIAEYTMSSRKGHIIRFWDEQLFRDIFCPWFEFEAFMENEELESVSLANQTFITIALARKKEAR